MRLLLTLALLAGVAGAQSWPDGATVTGPMGLASGLQKVAAYTDVCSIVNQRVSCIPNINLYIVYVSGAMLTNPPIQYLVLLTIKDGTLEYTLRRHLAATQPTSSISWAILKDITVKSVVIAEDDGMRQRNP
jgi:hypothetical protein